MASRPRGIPGAGNVARAQIQMHPGGAPVPRNTPPHAPGPRSLPLFGPGPTGPVHPKEPPAKPSSRPDRGPESSLRREDGGSGDRSETGGGGSELEESRSPPWPRGPPAQGQHRQERELYASPESERRERREALGLGSHLSQPPPLQLRLRLGLLLLLLLPPPLLLLRMPPPPPDPGHGRLRRSPGCSQRPHHTRGPDSKSPTLLPVRMRTHSPPLPGLRRKSLPLSLPHSSFRIYPPRPRDWRPRRPGELHVKREAARPLEDLLSLPSPPPPHRLVHSGTPRALPGRRF
uniref:Apidaecins type 73-like n=1 Tax=Phascolarctos cinereus TaxID=38626 RepID=A0A6P5KMV8_PHACI|nr:apidaecins type 73-like [Phascolarctos cinereus]